MADSVSRKDFVALVGTVVAAETLPGAVPVDAATAAPTHAAMPAPVHDATTGKTSASARPLGTEPEAYTFLTAPEWTFVEAAVERLIPTDAAGPGAREAGVAFYIDQQLAGAYGLAAKMYKQGPWIADASADFGYQLPLTPQQVYRLGIAATNVYCEKQYGKTFDALSVAHQDDVLKQLDTGTLAFDAVPAKAFFEMLYANTIEGFFADPLYGGNRNKVGWKLVGFPGAAAAYISFIEKHNVPYKVTPVGIADLQQQEQAMVDTHEAIDEMHIHMEIAKKALGVK